MIYNVLDKNGAYLGNIKSSRIERAPFLKIPMIHDVELYPISDKAPSKSTIECFTIEKCFNFYVLVDGDVAKVIKYLKRKEL